MTPGQTAHQRHDRGFTLVEIVIAIVLVGILSAVVVVGIGSLTSRGTTAACTTSKDAARGATTVFFGSTGAQPTTFTQMTSTSPAVLTLPDGATVSQNGLVVSTTYWTLTMTPGTGSASPTFVCSTDLPPGFVVGPNGHAYAFVAAPGISHAAALGAAATYSAAGGQVGHLATLTDAAEHSFAFSLVGSRSAWLGGSDSAVEGTWLWVTGPEAGTVFANGVAPVGGSYVNWQNGQPDNANEEDCLHFRIGMPNGWNDAPCEWSANAGYVVEISL